MRAAPEAEPRLARAVTVFSVLWAIAHVAHVLRKGDPANPWVWIVLGAAFLLLDRPASRHRLALLACAQLAYVLASLPRTDNHMVIMGFVHLGLLAAIVLGGRGRPADDPQVVAAAFPYIRVTILIAYGAAAVAKLNHGFFDLAESCAVAMYHDAVAVLDGRVSIPELSESAERALPVAVAATEIAVPLLLLVPATRLAGVALVVVFHLSISLSPSATALDFTMVLFALVFLFLPAPAAEHVTARVQAAWKHVPGASRISRSLTLIATASVAAAMLSQSGFGIATFSGNRNWLWLAAGALIVGALLLDAVWEACRRGWQRDAPAPLDAPPGRAVVIAQAAAVGLLVVNAASPYIGGKTVSSFTMYSNLQTEARSSNHFFLPRLTIFTGQDELVLVEESSNQRLHTIGQRGRLITWHELRRELTTDPDAAIRYRLGDSTVEHAAARENPELVTTHPIAHRLVAHRVYDPQRQRCLW